jgi:hypothetical protein
MESLLIAVTIVSLGLAVSMSVVAWTLLKTERRRAAARIEALEALAFTGERERQPAATDGPRPPAAVASVPLSADVRSQSAVEDGPAAEIDLSAELPDWDAVIRGHASEAEHDADTMSPARQPHAILPDAMFGAEAASNASARRWLVVAAIALLLAAGYATASAMRSPEVVAAVAASTPVPPAEPQPLELLSLKHSTETGGGFLISGFVQNPVGGRDLTNVEAVVYLFDHNDQYFMTGRVDLSPADLRSGTDAPFEIHVAGARNVGRYRVGFRQADGTVVAHVDRRGQFPDGTSETVLGDQVQPAGGMR